MATTARFPGRRLGRGLCHLLRLTLQVVAEAEEVTAVMIVVALSCKRWVRSALRRFFAREARGRAVSVMFPAVALGSLRPSLECLDFDCSCYFLNNTISHNQGRGATYPKPSYASPVPHKLLEGRMCHTRQFDLRYLATRVRERA